ncbi:hypothetical protein B0T24DRAFT_646818 [Lasiosphaeria ovina]|uniref:Nephrocystin 3-like N-terminal domain-containing protein n=1 Tax=Lasiosphaeria ovina TaxID=92902 RepID=A0AAE0ND68_9PEZI|nr:hypothetical protein B0T24DRAFT_646818 [Lasiosphaeria ovina]
MHFGLGRKHRAPSPSPDPIVREWLDAEGGRIDEALGRRPETPAQAASPQQTAGNASQPPPELGASSEGLREALRQYQKLDIDPRLNLHVDNCTWGDVFQCMANAQADYEQKAKKWRGCVRKLFRQAGDIADHVDPLLGLIPDEYGLGVIGAGISLIFMLAKTASQNRDTILAAFEEIPAIVASARTKLKLQPDDEVLKACGSRLDVTILVSVSELVGSLLPSKHAQRVPYFWLKRKLSHTDIEDVLTRLRRDTDELKRLVQDVLEAAIIETRDTVVRIEEITVRTDDKTSAIVVATSQMNEKADRLKGDTKTIMNQTSTLMSQSSYLSHQLHEQGQILTRIEADRKREREVMTSNQRKAEEREKCRDGIESVLQDVLIHNQRQGEKITYLYAQLRSLTPIQGLMTADQLIAAIGAVEHIEQSTADVEKVLQLRDSIHPVAESEAVSLLQTATFRSWLLPGHSDVVLIDGAGGAVEFIDHAERVSAKSILCALLLSQLTRLEPECFRIYFFCGLHSSERDALSDGPRGLMRSLLCDLTKEAHRRQLLRLDFIDDKRYRDGLQQQRIEYLCQAFYQILQHMIVGAALDLPIYCVIDGIAQYEKKDWLTDLATVMGMFRAIINDTKLKPCFKLLMTGPHRVRYVSEMVGLSPSKRLVAKPNITSENSAVQLGMQSGAEQMLQARRQQMIAQRGGQSQYHDDQYSRDDYE